MFSNKMKTLFCQNKTKRSKKECVRIFRFELEHWNVFFTYSKKMKGVRVQRLVHAGSCHAFGVWLGECFYVEPGENDFPIFTYIVV